MQSPAAAALHDVKKNPKDVIHRYLSKIKPFYVLASRLNGDKLRISGQLAAGEPEGSEHSRGLRFVSGRLRKSRSASAVVQSPARRRGDSLILHEDGIQGAIAHCKRSFNEGKGIRIPIPIPIR